MNQNAILPILKIQINEPILERGALQPIQVTPEVKEVQIEFKREVTFNSLGIREWITWISPLSKDTNLKIKLFGCPVSMVQQMNLLAGFLPSQAEVVSFYIPFYSDETDESEWVLATQGKEIQGKKLSISAPKDSTGKEMELDVKPDIYFKFLGLTLKE